jgi:hypothetical protein
VKSFINLRRLLADELLRTVPFHTGEWHAMDTSKSPAHATYELMGRTFKWDVPDSVKELQELVPANQPWADEHFAERVGGVPLNPPPSHANWPWARHNAEHQSSTGRFSHTYPERFWPRYAGNKAEESGYGPGNRGIWHRYGDLSDVVDLLVRSPLTRQAYLPVWFPEDTGAHHGQRVPCTLGYHFMVRGGKLHCWYAIRSCDFIRHFTDDVYLAARLVLWMCDQVNDHWESIDHFQAPGPVPPSIEPGLLTMTVSSLHAFVGDNASLTRLTLRGIL